MTPLAALWFTIAAASDGWNNSKAYDHFYNLDYDRALELLETDSAADAHHQNHLAYAVLYRALYRGGALDSSLATATGSFLRRPKVPMPPEDQKRFQSILERSIAISKDRLAKNPKDSEALYTLGVAHVHRANYEIFVNRSWRAALRDGTEARRLHQEAAKLDPRNIDALLVPATHDYIVGSLPWYARAIGFLAGFRGDKEGGLKGIERVAREGQRTRVEAQVLQALAYRRAAQPAEAARVMKQLAERFPRNYLYRMEMVNSLADARRFDEAKREADRLRDYANLKPERYQSFRTRLDQRQ